MRAATRNVAGACDSDCTQRTDGVCDGTFLEQVIQGPSIKYAFCNDKWLILLTSGEGGVFEPTLNNVPSPSPACVRLARWVTPRRARRWKERRGFWKKEIVGRSACPTA